MNLIINTNSLENLRVNNILETHLIDYTIYSACSLDITFLGLIQNNWEFVKGKRVSRKYYCPNDNTKLAIEDIYTYQHKPNTWEFYDYERKLIYYDVNGNIGVEKLISNNHSQGKITKLNRDVKIKVIDLLRERGKNLLLLSQTVADPLKTFYINIANSTDSLLTYYYDVIHKQCIDFTWQSWIDAINNETDTTILNHLNTIASSDGITTVKDYIIAEIT